MQANSTPGQLVKNHMRMKKKAKQPIKRAKMFPVKSINVVEVPDSSLKLRMMLYENDRIL
jgi:hypothetical protein